MLQESVGVVHRLGANFGRRRKLYDFDELWGSRTGDGDGDTCGCPNIMNLSVYRDQLEEPG